MVLLPPKAFTPPIAIADIQPVPPAKTSSLEEAIAAVGAALDKKGKVAAAKRSLMKRPAAAVDDLDITGAKPNVCVVASRSCVTARTGLNGPGHTKSISFKDDVEQATAVAEAKKWLKAKCDDFGIEYDAE